MKFGAALPYVSARGVMRLAHEAEQAGWDGVFVGDAIWTQDPLVGLAAAAVQTSRVRLGTMVIPAPLRKPWKIASEALALDHLSEGRLTLGLGAGAVWMGWHAFPDETTNTRERAEMLGETLEILDRMFQGQPFDYDGRHYHVRLTQLSEDYYPPRPVQQPRIPLWVVGVWPRLKSMQRVLDYDGVLPNKMDDNGQFVDITPEDVREMKRYIEANRTANTPFDIVVEGKTAGVDEAELRDKLHAWEEAGATWWINGLWEQDEEGASALLRKGSPVR